jgi:hypothetical protein
MCGQEWIRTTEVERQRIYSPPHLAALEPAQPIIKSQRRDSNPRPADYKSAALPAELLWLDSRCLQRPTRIGIAKVMENVKCKNFVQENIL